MNLEHAQVECILQDYYAGDWIDRLDELKTNIDERAVIANAGAYALGRKTDELIIGALDTATREALGTAAGTTDTDGLTREKVLTAFEMLGAADVPDDGGRFAVVGWKQWSQLLAMPEFASAEYVGDAELPWKGTAGQALARRHLDPAFGADEVGFAPLLLLLPPHRGGACRRLRGHHGCLLARRPRGALRGEHDEPGCRAGGRPRGRADARG
jgi:hypothetical protein